MPPGPPCSPPNLIMLSRLLALALLASTFTSARPLVARSACPSNAGDAPYSLSCDELAAAPVTFPHGNQKKAGGIVLLVHGTGSTGDESWASGPYTQVLPNKGRGYDVAYITLPNRTLGDAQVTAEYIAYNIGQLASQSSTGQISVIGHSQGNINIQWALDFWPSTRSRVAAFVSLAGDFHGTGEGPLACLTQDLTAGGCEPSVIQQTVGSHYLNAQNSKGNQALVPTTSLYTIEDDIIQPEVGPSPTSNLPGASVITVQQACGPLFLADHFTMIVTAPAFYLALDALEHGGHASLSRFNPLTSCSFLVDTFSNNTFSNIPALVRSIALDAIALGTSTDRAQKEPLLMPYVCQRGDATSYCA